MAYLGYIVFGWWLSSFVATVIAGLVYVDYDVSDADAEKHSRIALVLFGSLVSSSITLVLLGVSGLAVPFE